MTIWLDEKGDKLLIGFQKIIIDQNIKVTQLAKELNIKPGRIWNWIQANKVSEKCLNMVAERFNVEKDYINTIVNNINTFETRKKGFNKYIVKGDVT